MIKSNQILHFILILLTATFVSACSKQLYEFNPSTAVYYPPPPDTSRVQFLTSISNSTSIVKQRSGFTKFLLGELPVKTIIKPYGISSLGGKIYICDTDLGGLEILDLVDKKFEYFSPRGKGQLSKPLNCCLDDLDNLYVTDGKRKQVVIFDPSGAYLDAIGESGNFMPIDVAVSDSIIYVVSIDSHEIVCYSKRTRKRLFNFPNSNPDEDEFLHSPLNIDISDSIVYVSDIGASKVKKYSLNGEYLGSFGSYGRNLGQFVRLKGLAVDRESNLYTVDAAFENVQIFNDKDQLLMYFGGSTKEPGGMWLPAQVSIDYDNMEYFQQYIDPDFNIEYLIYVTNQYGPYKINVYGFITPKGEGKK